jgi:MraZ protein
MFGGSYLHSLDPAGRFVMPLKMRLQLGEEFVITKGIGCLCVFTKDWASKLERELNELGSPLAILLNPDIARLHRHFFNEMVFLGTDKQFRVQLTPEHRKYADIEDEVLICGCGNHVELWSPKAYDAYRQHNDNIEDLISSGAALLARREVGGDAGVSQTCSS